MNVQTVSLWNLSGVANRGMARLPPEPGALTAAQQVTSTRVDGHIIVLMNRPQRRRSYTARTRIAEARRSTPVGFQNPAMACDQRFQAAGA
jgi:hypothetical protein